VALLHADGSVDINVPGVGIHSRVARSAIQALSAEEVDEFGLLSARDSMFEMMGGVLDQDIPELCVGVERCVRGFFRGVYPA
jgi:hypothetical protein